MGMTIDKAKDILTSEDFAGYSISEILEARDLTLDIMSKYQKIEQVTKEWGKSGLLQDKFYDLINEVLEDGNDNRFN